MFHNVLKGKNESKPQGSIACNDLADPLVFIVTEHFFLMFSKSQFAITENYNPFVRKGFVSLIGDLTSLQPIKI